MTDTTIMVKAAAAVTIIISTACLQLPTRPAAQGSTPPYFIGSKEVFVNVREVKVGE